MPSNDPRVKEWISKAVGIDWYDGVELEGRMERDLIYVRGLE